MSVGAPGGEQVLSRPGGFIVAAQDLQQTRRQHGIAVLAAFALFDAEEHALRVDGSDFECHRFAHAQSGAVAGHQGGAVLEAGDVVKERVSAGLKEQRFRRF